MDAETSFSPIAPPVFNGDNYQVWAVRMETYLDSLDLWEVVEEDYNVPTLPNNPTMAQIKAHKEKKKKNNVRLVEEFKKKMLQVFEMTDLGLMTYFLGMEIKQSCNEIFICQKKYAREILKKFHMENCKVTSTPMNPKEKLSKEDGTDRVDEGNFRSLIGCLMYLTTTRPDIPFVVSFLSRFMHCSTKMHFQVAKRIIRYIKGTVEYGDKFKKCENFKLYGFSDSDLARSTDDMKSISGYCFSLGSGIFSWCSKKKETMAQSTIEAEFIAAITAINQSSKSNLMAKKNIF
ncbi:uncharacterized mitochondrial protein AtMg00810-like [Capsicum annuum]|uniref:uncharacterized mitochondrial protein AtMg00810-like n=1 Tax=Capsicum annuum TaxID=4072 RepID=UPI0007BF50B5|nr:uncharacterized mitochondrial protein AtMg00810-like [Capsicum annuum]